MDAEAEHLAVLRFSRRRPEWLPGNTVGLVGAGLALVIPLLSVRVTDAPGWVGRYALLPIEAAIGVPLLIALLRGLKQSAARAASAFVVIAAVSTVASDNITMSFWGNEYWGTGLLFVLAMAGIWS